MNAKLCLKGRGGGGQGGLKQITWCTIAPCGAPFAGTLRWSVTGSFHCCISFWGTHTKNNTNYLPRVNPQKDNCVVLQFDYHPKIPVVRINIFPWPKGLGNPQNPFYCHLTGSLWSNGLGSRESFIFLDTPSLHWKCTENALKNWQHFIILLLILAEN
jgi:hypothetical protein